MQNTYKGAPLKIREFDPVTMMPKSATCIIIAPPASGKTTLMKNLIESLAHRYVVGRVFSGTNDSYNDFKDIFGDLFVTEGYDEEKHKKQAERQRRCVNENGKGAPQNLAISILDDLSNDTKIYKTPLMADLFKNGSQHYDQLFFILLQYAIDIPVALRRSVSCVMLFKESNEAALKQLYTNFGGACGTYKEFKYLMDTVTGDHRALVIMSRGQSTNLEDHVFWYRTHVPKKPIKFGCRESRVWNDLRANKNYDNEYHGTLG